MSTPIDGVTMNQIANDPMWQYYYQQGQLYNAMYQGGTQNTGANAGSSNVSFQGNTSYRPTATKKSYGGVIAGGLFAAGTIASMAYAVKRGNGQGMIQGFKNIWKGIKGTADDVAKKVTGNAAKPNALRPQDIRMAEINGHRVVQLPDKVFRFSAKDTGITAADKARSIGIPSIPKLTALPKNANIYSYSFIEDGVKIDVIKGKVQKATMVSTNTEIPLQGEFKRKIDDIIGKVAKGEKTSLNKLEKITYHWEKDGTVLTYMANKASDVPVFKHGKSVWHPVGDDVVKDYRAAHAEFNEAFRNFTTKKDNWKVCGATCRGTDAGIRGDSKVYKIVDGEIVGYTDGSRYVASTTDEFKRFRIDHEKDFEKILENNQKWKNHQYVYTGAI